MTFFGKTELLTVSSVTCVKGENMRFVIYGRDAQRKPLSLDLAFKETILTFAKDENMEHFKYI